MFQSYPPITCQTITTDQFYSEEGEGGGGGGGGGGCLNDFG